MFSGAEMEAVLGSLPVALITTDHERRVLAANSAALELFGYQLEELEGQCVELLIPKPYAERHPDLYHQFVVQPSNRSMGKGRDLAALKKDGTEFPVEVGLTVLSINPPKYLASIIDISLRKKTELLLRERQQLLESALVEAKESLGQEISERSRLEERQRLGRELHDSLSQNLYGIGLGLRTALAKVNKQEDPCDPLKYCLSLTEASLVEMRALLFRLRPKSLENVPLADVLESHTQAVAARTKLKIEFRLEGTCRGELPFEQKYALYRIVTESLHNCVKHAKAKTVKVLLSCDINLVSVEVRDDGGGFCLQDNVVGHGLAAMRERIQAVNGSLQIESSPEGTCVSASAPWI